MPSEVRLKKYRKTIESLKRLILGPENLGSGGAVGGRGLLICNSKSDVKNAIFPPPNTTSKVRKVVFGADLFRSVQKRIFIKKSRFHLIVIFLLSN